MAAIKAAIWRSARNAGGIALAHRPAEGEAQAKAENKIVLMDFTGSDWCRWCIKFDKEVLDTPEFAEYAANERRAGATGFSEQESSERRLEKGQRGVAGPIQGRRFSHAGRAGQGRQGNRQAGRLCPKAARRRSSPSWKASEKIRFPAVYSPARRKVPRLFCVGLNYSRA